MPAFKDITNRRFGRLTALRRAENSPRGHVKWHCRCDCGNKSVVHATSLMSGKTTSCGCFSRERVKEISTKHGFYKSPEYRIWSRIKDRCNNPNSDCYDGYGGRGITLDPSWEIFENFYTAMGPRPSPNHSIDRIDNNKGYSKENCRWATSKEQSRNKRSNRYLTLNGKTLLLVEWAEKLNCSPRAIQQRIDYYGWSVEKALTTPVKKYRKPKP